MIVVTGAAGFIGSCLIGKLNNIGIKDIIAVDDFSAIKKWKNLETKIIRDRIDRMQFFEWLSLHAGQVKFVFHLGARTDTTEFDVELFNRLNLNYSKNVWEHCAKYEIPLVYASSAATYGKGEHGYFDNHSVVPSLVPLNPYGRSKNDFDLFVLQQKESPPFWAGLKFFNVFGPNEYHKGRMASVVYHAFNQIKKTGKLKLFKSHLSGFEDGQQQRDFIFVKDVIRVCVFLMQHQIESGIYNLGTGNARSFYALGEAVFRAMNREPEIEFIDMPLDIRETYQYFTCAEMQKLRKAGYQVPFTSLEDGVMEYIVAYLSMNQYY